VEEIREMKNKDLKALCEKIQLSKTGKRSELIDRIIKCKESLNKQFEDDNMNDTDEENDEEYSSHEYHDED
jgi:hypothetical protein